MRPFFGALLLFFILFFSETEASGPYTPRFFKKKKGESSKEAEGVSDAIAPPPQYTVSGTHEPVDEQAEGKAKKKAKRKSKLGNHDSADLQEAHMIKKKPLKPNVPFPEHLPFYDNQDLHYQKDEKEYDHYQKFQAAFGQYAPPSYPPNPETKYADYLSGGGAHSEPFENVVSQQQHGHRIQQQLALQNQEEHALQIQQQHAFLIEQQHALQTQQQIALQNQQQQALQHQQQQALLYQQQQSLLYQQQQALSNQQPHAFYNNMGYYNNLNIPSNYPGGLPNPDFPGGPSGGDPNIHFHGGHSGGDPNPDFHGGHSGGHGSGHRD